MTDENKTPVKKGKATEISHTVAEVLLALRQDRDMSQRAFAEHIGVSFQQYQKYEKAKDRLSLERAIMLCSELGIPLDIFMPADEAVHGFSETTQAPFGKAGNAKSISADEQELLDLYTRIPKKARQNFLETVRQMAKMAAGKN